VSPIRTRDLLPSIQARDLLGTFYSSPGPSLNGESENFGGDVSNTSNATVPHGSLK
jgi:hypothetical protein